MSHNHSITRLLPGVKQADEAAVRELFDRCYSRVVRLAKRKLRDKSYGGFNEEDPALAAFHTFLDRAATGKYKQLECREDVWQLLALLLGSKIKDRLRHERAKKRGGGKPDLTIDDLQQEICNLSDPALLAECNDVKNRIFAELEDNEYRRVLELLEDGLTRKQIADELVVSLSTIDRRLRVIRNVILRLGILDIQEAGGKGEDNTGENK